MPDGGSGLNRHERRRRAARQRRYTIADFHQDSAGVFSIAALAPLDLALLIDRNAELAAAMVDWLARIEEMRPLCACCDTVFTAEIPPGVWLIAQPVGNPASRGVMMMGACEDCCARHPTAAALIAAVGAQLKRETWPDLRVLDPVHFGAGGRA
ncbi:MAG TPA: hypothetical protein VFC56_07745 [Stellaceae bacterium]|nr:hypothetical protein [Stellaceae bacterium]